MAVMQYRWPSAMAGRPIKDPGAARRPDTDLSASLLVNTTSPALNRNSLLGGSPCRKSMRLAETSRRFERASIASASSQSVAHSEITVYKIPFLRYSTGASPTSTRTAGTGAQSGWALLSSLRQMEGGHRCHRATTDDASKNYPN